MKRIHYLIRITMQNAHITIPTHIWVMGIFSAAVLHRSETNNYTRDGWMELEVADTRPADKLKAALEVSLAGAEIRVDVINGK